MALKLFEDLIKAFKEMPSESWSELSQTPLFYPTIIVVGILSIMMVTGLILGWRQEKNAD